MFCLIGHVHVITVVLSRKGHLLTQFSYNLLQQMSALICCTNFSNTIVNLRSCRMSGFRTAQTIHFFRIWPPCLIHNKQAKNTYLFMDYKLVRGHSRLPKNPPLKFGGIATAVIIIIQYLYSALKSCKGYRGACGFRLRLSKQVCFEVFLKVCKV